MPPADVKTIREEVFYEYAKLISRTVFDGEINYRFVSSRFKALRTIMRQVVCMLSLAGLAGLLAAGVSWGQEQPPAARMVLLDFDGNGLAVNKAGDGYPTYYDGRRGARHEGGVFAASLSEIDAVKGRSLQLRLTEGAFYAQFNPYDEAGNRSFARDYCRDPKGWRFNTYNRMRFWIKLPEGATPHRTDGRANLNVGTYVKRLRDPDPRSDEAGGDHYYHMINIPAVGAWTQVILNMHPDHRRGDDGGIDPGNLAHPTHEDEYNYFDTLTRFYIQDERAPATFPADYLLDEIEFYQGPATENDEQVYSLTGTYLPQSNRFILCWGRRKNDTKVRHEVRYAFEDIHRLDWDEAKPAPNGTITPPGPGGYNGMVYDTTDLPLTGRKVVYLAVKPENSTLFSQIAMPLQKK
jgi:hypothetical protein